MNAPASSRFTIVLIAVVSFAAAFLLAFGSSRELHRANDAINFTE
jgi:hypothetical protein